MSGEIIKSFLVSLGFDIDESELAKFNKAIVSASVKVAGLFTAVQATATGIGLGISKISEDFEQLGYQYHIIAPAINKALVLRRELLRAYGAAGINITKTIQESIKLNMSLTKTKYAFEAIYKSVGSKFFALLTKQSDLFRQKIYANMPKIQHVLESFVNFVFKALDATTQLGLRLWSILTRVYDFFVKLDKATDGWSTIILGVVAAWKLLNLSFLATPLGLLITGLTAILALWDDFKTFKEGGKSLIDWGSDTTKTMIGVAAAIAGVITAIGSFILISKGVSGVIAAWQAIQGLISILTGLNEVLGITDILMLALEAPFWVIIGVISALVAALTLLDNKWKIFGGSLSGFFSSIGGKISNFVGGADPNIQNNVKNSPTGAPSTSPLGAGSINSSQVNQSVQQQTNINVNSSADASSVGKAVSGEQSKVNFDLARNFKKVSK